MSDISGTNVIKAPDEVSLKDIVLKFGALRRYLLSKWKVIIGAFIIGAMAGILFITLEKPVYTAELTFVLGDSEKSSAIGGQYSALASMVGIDVSAGGGIFQGDNIIELYKSRLMLEKTLLTPALIEGKHELLIDKYIEINNARSAWNKKPKLLNINFDIPRQKFSLQHDSLISAIVIDLKKYYLTVEKPDKKLSIISVKIKSDDQYFSKAFTDNLVNNVNAFYVQTKTKTSLQNVILLQHQLDSVRRTLNTSIGASAAAVDYNPNPNPELQVLKVPSQRRQVDVQSGIAIYSEVTKNLEIARGVLQRETPLIQVIDQPVLPLVNSNSGRAKGAIIGALLLTFFTIIYLLVMRLYRNIIM